jgi:glycolate oxidase iron-sulfur subunit
MNLGIDPDELASCVSCGLCLPHCPTFRVTGEEARSPRRRIAAMRAVQLGGAPIDDEFEASIETCVQCRGCETACPSGVPFGHLIEPAKASVTAAHRTPRRRVLSLAYRPLGHHRLLLALSTLLALAQRLRLVPPSVARRCGLPAKLPLRRPPLTATGDDVWLFTGCVMDAWQRDVHLAVKRVIEATGAGVRPTTVGGADCCGALASHGGFADQARALAERTMRAIPGDAPILVDAAGCGAMLRDYGHLLGTDEARRFSARVLDVHEWLAVRLDSLPAPAATAARPRPTVAVQDPCHLRHVQRAHLPVRLVRARYVDVVDLADDGLCCGAGGAYSVLQPGLAGDIRERKLASIARTGAPVVVSANPGCSMHLAAAGVDVRHPLELVEEAIRGR